MVVVARGPSHDNLSGGTSYGPYSPDELETAFWDAVNQLKSEGFEESGAKLALTEFDSNSPRTSALAALRLGRQGRRQAVDALLGKLPTAGDGVCSILDALGAMGDKKAIPTLREFAGRKLLSRRRSALEALRRLGDDEGVETGREQAIDRLTGDLTDVYRGLDESLSVKDRGKELFDAASKIDSKYWGLISDTLYEIGDDVSVLVARQFLETRLNFAQSFHWRYIKSIFKRARLRLDHKMFGYLSHAIEAKGRHSKGTTAYVKSGYDGQKRQVNVFRRKTQNYMRRLSWRHMRELAVYNPNEYAHCAAELLIHYSSLDEQSPVGFRGRYARCYMLHRIYYGRSKRFDYDAWKMQFRFKSFKYVNPPKKSVEFNYPELWDAQPLAWLRVLSEAQLPMVQELACEQVTSKHLSILEQASNECLLGFLKAPHAQTAKLGIKELERRFDAQNPDWDLLEIALFHSHDLVRRCGEGWLELTAPHWTKDADRLMKFLAIEDGRIRSKVIEIAIAALPQHTELRAQLAPQFLEIMRAPEKTEGQHDAYGRVAGEVLLDELQPLLELSEVMAWLDGGSGAAKVLAGRLLGRYSGAVESLGLQGLISLAQNEIHSARAASHELLRSILPALQEDPSALFILVESEWADSRDLAFDILKNKIAIEQLGFDGIFGLCDSNREDVQKFGSGLLLEHLDEFDPHVIVSRISEHPQRSMRSFTLDLVTAIEKLIKGAAPLAQLVPFFRAALFDLKPERAIKDRVFQFLLSHGLESEEQAREASQLLSDLLFTDIKADFDPILEVLVTLKLKYPELVTPALSIVGEDSQ